MERPLFSLLSVRSVFSYSTGTNVNLSCEKHIARGKRRCERDDLSVTTPSVEDPTSPYLHSHSPSLDVRLKMSEIKSKFSRISFIDWNLTPVSLTLVIHREFTNVQIKGGIFFLNNNMYVQCRTTTGAMNVSEVRTCLIVHLSDGQGEEAVPVSAGLAVSCSRN